MTTATAGTKESSSPFGVLKDFRATLPAPDASTDQATTEEGSSSSIHPIHRKELKVVFDHLDTDSMLCAWVFCRHIARRKKVTCHPTMVDSGTKLSDEEAADFEVEYVDMGGGDCDHHGKGLVYTSSFDLVLKKYGFADDPGMQVLLEMSKKADNAVEIPWDSMHHIVTGALYDQNFRANDGPDVSRILDFAFVCFDICYRQAQYREKTKNEYLGSVNEEILTNGLKIALLENGGKFRGYAFERGVDLVIATEQANKKDRSEGIMVQIMVNRKSKLNLAPLAAHLRYAEMANRGMQAKFAKLDMVGMHPQVPGWYLHDPQPEPENGQMTHKLLVCGTRKHPGTKETRTVLTPKHILRIARSKLGGKTDSDA